MERISEREFIREHNRVYGEILENERKKRKISRAELAYGILSRTALENVEKGRTGWTKLEGDTLMQRMGISADYFETLSSAEELDRWRLREDICLTILDKPQEAREKIREYREKYKKRVSLEEQFLLKAEVILMMMDAGEAGNIENRESGRSGMREGILTLARQSADCTVPKGWDEGGNLADFFLAPGELEAILLVSAAMLFQGRIGEAWELQQAVWNYPGKHQWEERLQVLILPQAAIMGIRILRKSIEADSKASAMAFDRTSTKPSANANAIAKSFYKSIDNSKELALKFGKEALELLRRNCCHCYVLLLLECLCDLPAEEPEEKAYLGQAGKFKEAFREIYQWFGCPEYRLWQGISADNTLEAGLTLEMLRKFYGKSRADAVSDGAKQVVTERQLEKIEKGIHKPSYGNYNRLAKQYGKYGGWNMPLLETASAEVLELRQEISTLINFEEWQEAEWKLEWLRRKADVRYPRVRQEILFWDAILKWKKEGELEESLSMMLEALRYTVPDFEGRDMKWWVYQREEIMLASDIASLYRRLGRLEEAGKWFDAVIFSVQQQSRRTGVCSYGYDLLIDGFSNYLGDICCYEEAVRVSEECNRKLLMYSNVSEMRSMLYHIAWNAYESAEKGGESYEVLQQKWEKAFRLSERMADFMYDLKMKIFLEERREKYLQKEEAKESI